MIAVNIENKEIENFYKQECNGNQSTFIENILQYVKNYKIKASIKQGMQEVREIQSGKRVGQDLKSFLNEL